LVIRRLKANGILYKSFTKKYLEKGVGLLQGHALDGNNRRQKLILNNICKGTYNLRIQGFLMCVEMVNIALAIMMQDQLHVG
jgi:hypothetical protein